MRKTVIILSIFVLVGSDYIQSTKKQEATNTKEAFTTFNNTNLADTQNTHDNQSFSAKRINSAKYFNLKEKANIQKIELEKITNMEQAKKMLKGRVMWGKYVDTEDAYKLIEDERGDAIFKIVCRNGKSYSFPSRVDFIAYYPQEDILLCEGGHTSDVSFNLTTGEDTENTGNPEYIISSHSKQSRLNGYDDGQERIHYFIQKKIDGKYHRIIDLYNEFPKKTDIHFFRIPDAFWENDTTLNVSITHYPDGYNLEKVYYQIILNE